MAHELTIRANGSAEMAYVGDLPWHGLGQQLAAGAPIEVWRTAAGMEWHVMRAPVEYRAMIDGAERVMPFADVETGETKREVLYRSDTGAPLGVLSPGYRIVQPADVLEFFRDLTADAGYTLETAGTLFGGRKFWALARVASGSVGADDAIGGFVLLNTSCDGTTETEARRTTVRVVCNNTLTMARAYGANGPRPVVKVGHRETFDGKRAQRVKRDLGIAREEFAQFLDDARKLAAYKVTDAEAAEFVRAILRPDEAAAKQAAAQAADAVAEASRAIEAAAASAGTLVGADLAAKLAASIGAPATTNEATETKQRRAPRGEAAILDLFHGRGMGSQFASADGTAWGLLNAVTEFVDHEATAKSDSHRAASAWFGAGEELKTAAYTAAMARFA